jgi:hypothetical protein
VGTGYGRENLGCFYYQYSNSWAGVFGKGTPTHRVDLGCHGNIPLPSLFSLLHSSPHRGSILCPITHTGCCRPKLPAPPYFPATFCHTQLQYPVDISYTSESEVFPAVTVRCWCSLGGGADGPRRAVNPGRSRLQQRSTSGAIDCWGILHVEPRLSCAPSPNSTPFTSKRKKKRVCLQVTIESTLLEVHESLTAATCFLNTFPFHSPGSVGLALMSGGRNVCLVGTQVVPREYLAYGRGSLWYCDPLDNTEIYARSVLVSEMYSSGNCCMTSIRLYCESRNLNTLSLQVSSLSWLCKLPVTRA